jgi:hypothetical protein
VVIYISKTYKKQQIKDNNKEYKSKEENRLVLLKKTFWDSMENDEEIYPFFDAIYEYFNFQPTTEQVKITFFLIGNSLFSDGLKFGFDDTIENLYIINPNINKEIIDIIDTKNIVMGG